MKTILLTVILTTLSVGLFSQDFEVPKNYTLEKGEDYDEFEQDVLKCFDWLMNTPIKEQASKRKEANAFLLKWLTGSPKVHLELKAEILTFMGTSPDLLIIFMGGWTKYALETKNFDSKIGGSKAGIESVIEFYNANRQDMPKDKNIMKYIKMQNKGTLNEYIEKNA